MPRKINLEVETPVVEPITVPKPKREITEAQREHLNKIRTLAMAKKAELKEITLKSKLAKTVPKQELAKKYDEYIAQKAVQAVKTAGTNLTTKVTADKLKKAWEAEGGNTDSEAVKIFLKQQGVDSAVIDSPMKAVGAPSTGADPTAADAAKGAEAGAAGASKVPAAGGSQFVQDLVAGYMALTPQERAEIMKELDIAIDVSGNSNLVKGMNESKRRKKAVR